MRHILKPTLLGVARDVLTRQPASFRRVGPHHDLFAAAVPGRCPWLPVRHHRGFANRSDSSQRRIAQAKAGEREKEREKGKENETKRPWWDLRPAILFEASAGIVLFAAVIGALQYFDAAGHLKQRRSSRIGGALNPDTFVSFEVAAREPVAPNAFVLTLRLPAGASAAARDATRDAVTAARRHGLWSVEVRQPQLQIAREYTPLPDVAAGGGGGEEDPLELRLFVRAVPGGEVSQYLARHAAVGSTVDLRGPRLSFDVPARLGRSPEAAGRRVVFVAGGTGIASALQTAAAVLQQQPEEEKDGSQKNNKPPVTILWANRLPQDSAGCSGNKELLPPETVTPNPIVRDLAALQQRFGADRVRVRAFVDAQQTFVDEGEVWAAMLGIGLRRAPSEGPWWPRRQQASSGGAAPSIPPPQSALLASGCYYHSAEVLEGLAADPSRESAEAKTTCTCTCSSTAAAPPGKNLVLVSGPDGFISALAGPKMWADGAERQGPVGGILGQLRRRDPQQLKDWLILKL